MLRVSDVKRASLESILRDAEERIWLLMADSHQKGKRWEEEFEILALNRGLAIEHVDGRGDRKVNGLVVQCKHIDAVRSRDAIDIANMRPVKSNEGRRGYMVGEYDVLALRHNESVYLIPAVWLEVGDGTLAIRIRLAEIDQFRDGWSVFRNDYKPPSRDKQLPFVLFEEATDGPHP